jgi:hypothetical protein
VSNTEQTLSFTLEDLVPNHVQRPVLTGFLVQIVTPPGVDPSATQPYLTLTLGKAAAVSFAPDRAGRFVYQYPATPKVADVEGTASLRFDLAQTPRALKAPHSGNLDPTALQNIVLTLFYDGEIRWS